MSSKVQVDGEIDSCFSAPSLATFSRLVGSSPSRNWSHRAERLPRHHGGRLRSCLCSIHGALYGDCSGYYVASESSPVRTINHHVIRPDWHARLRSMSVTDRRWCSTQSTTTSRFQRISKIQILASRSMSTHRHQMPAMSRRRIGLHPKLRKRVIHVAKQKTCEKQNPPAGARGFSKTGALGGT